MSRRRPKPPELPPRHSRRLAVKVVCSDRGQHGRIVLHHLHDTRDVLLDEDVMWPEGKRYGPPAAPRQAEDDAQGFRFQCPRCRRDVQLRQENLFKILDALTAQPDTSRVHPVLDISLLPC